MFYSPFYQLSSQMFLMLGIVMILTKITSGYIGFAITILGVYASFTRKPYWAIICFSLMPIMSVMNPMVFGFGRLSLISHVGLPIMSLAMVISSNYRSGKNEIPIKSIFLYIIIAAISSLGGYSPIISYLKLINFTLFVVGIYAGTKKLEYQPEGFLLLRAFFFAFSAFIVLGSFILNYVNPAAAHYSSHAWHIMTFGYDTYAKMLTQTQLEGGDLSFFCGITYHSQCMGPLGVCIMGWLLCDMLFLERKIMGVHLILLLICPILIYWTKSRTALFALVFLFLTVFLYCVPKFKISYLLKRRIKFMISIFLLFIVIVSVVSEYRHNSISKWLLKYESENYRNNLTVDNVLITRKGKIEAGLIDFMNNPILGSGFQVSPEMKNIDTSSRLIYSAPVEKGFMPTMVLGETGIIGICVFMVFLLDFYGSCKKNRYLVTSTLFSVFLVTNLGEATFFAPGGMAGPVWIFMLIGGFVIDITNNSSSSINPQNKKINKNLSFINR